MCGAQVFVAEVSLMHQQVRVLACCFCMSSGQVVLVVCMPCTMMVLQQQAMLACMQGRFAVAHDSIQQLFCIQCHTSDVLR
jgi:hypothetical protein